jgi:hypothetical protein
MAMEEEYAALMSNGTWDLVQRLRGANVVTDKWIFKHKFKADETLERYTQRPSVNYDETSSPIMKHAMVHIIPSLSLSRDWPIHQLDVKNAFLHSTLIETVYYTQPTSFFDLA